MFKAPFSGITVLDEQEDPAEFEEFGHADRETMDRLFEIGAVTHRHDAHAKLADPTASATVETSDVGGLLPAGATYWVTYTLTDPSGGETRHGPVTSVTTPDALQPPEEELIGVASYASGCLLADTYYYAITLVDGEGGETPLGAAVAVERVPGFEFGEITLSGLAAELGDATGWRLYRFSGATWDFLAEGTEDTYVDDGFTVPDCNFNAPADFNNSTGQTNRLSVTLPSAPAGADSFKLYISDDGAFESPSFYDSYPPASGGVTIGVPAMQFSVGRPPEVSQSFPGASQIDPDTDILDWHWKRPVASVDDLPAGELGDVRLVEDLGELFWYDADWAPLQGGGAASGFSGSAATTRFWRDPRARQLDPVADSGAVSVEHDTGFLWFVPYPDDAEEGANWQQLNERPLRAAIDSEHPSFGLNVYEGSGSSVAAVKTYIWHRVVVMQGYVEIDPSLSQQEFATIADLLFWPEVQEPPDGPFPDLFEPLPFVVASSDGPITITIDYSGILSYPDFGDGWPARIHLNGMTWIASDWGVTQPWSFPMEEQYQE